MRVIPAIDLRGGHAVRLRQGDYAQETVFGDDPVAVARTFQPAEIIHVVDLDGARDGTPVHVDVVRQIAALGCPVEIGGGVRSEADVETWLEVGVARVVVGSLLVRDPDLAKRLFARFGDKIVAGIDARNGRMAAGGWIDTSDVSARELAVRMHDAGARVFVVTDIATDGMMAGPNLDFLAEMADGLDAEVVASGGVSSLADLKAVASVPGIDGAIIGRALYEGAFSLEQALAAVVQ